MPQSFSVIIRVEKRSIDDLIARPVFPDLTQVEQKEGRQEESLSANLPHPFHSRNCSELGLFSILVDWEKTHGFYRTTCVEHCNLQKLKLIGMENKFKS